MIICKNIPHAFEVIEKTKDRIENIWVIGGSSVYKVRCLYKINENILITVESFFNLQATIKSPNFYRLYLTRIKKYFECDAFFPTIPNDFVLTE